MTRKQKPRANVQSTPEQQAKRREYYSRPEVQARYKLRNGSEAHKAYMLEYRNRPENRDRMADANLRIRFFTLDLKRRLMELQGNRCAICDTPFDLSKPRLIHADHCHDTKTPRGMLCNHCNHAEGHIRRVGLTAQQFTDRLAAYIEATPVSRLPAED